MITGGIQLHHGIPLRQTIIQYQGKAEAMRVVLNLYSQHYLMH